MRLCPAVVFCAFSAVLLASSAAPAQDAKQGEFSVQRFFPAPGPRNFVTVEGARTDGKMAWSTGLFFNYAQDPFTVRSCRTVDDCSGPNPYQPTDIHVVRSMATADVLGSFTPMPLLQIGLRVPVSYVDGDGIDATQGTAKKGGEKGAGLGDPYLEGKVRVFGKPDDVLVLGLAGFLTGPAGTNTATGKYIGDSSVTTGLRGIFDGKSGPFSFGTNVAGLWRKTSKLGSTELGPEFRYGIGAGYEASPILRVVGEGYGTTKFSSKNGTNSMEAVLAGQITPLQSRFSFTLGGGAGVLQGVGVPKFRVFAGVLYNHEIADRDGDGIVDDKDQCPTEPEDFDGFEDQDGCPDPDNDGDGILDKQDACPNVAGERNDDPKKNGCPAEIHDRDADGIVDEEDKCPDQGGNVVRRKGDFYGCPDRDKDGIPDKIDQCPDEPEDTDGVEDDDGCPEDDDRDGIPDAEDACPQTWGIKTNDPATNGCPDKDTDGDGIPDSRDKCPTKPENYNGFEDEDGCPDQGPSLVEVGGDQIRIKEQINFATNSDKIVGQKSFQVLDAVVSVLKVRPEIQKIEVAGHTDNVGNAKANTDLSKRRAAAVVTYLTGKGVDAGRLGSQGYGPDKPIADNKTAAGRQKNRRVEFNITQQAGRKPGSPAPGGAPAPPAAAAPAPAPAPKPAQPAKPGQPAPRVIDLE